MRTPTTGISSPPGPAGGTAYSRWELRTRRHPLALDAVMVLLLCICSFSGAALSAPGAPAPSQPTGAGAIAASCVVLFGHRRFPRAVSVVAIACTIALAALGFVLTPLLLAPTMMALFLLTLHASRRSAFLLTLAAILGVSLTAVVAGPAAESLGLKLLGPQAWLLLPTLAGVAASSRSQYEARARDEEARHRVAEERVRIARELHDAVAHHLALANAQAGTVAYLIAADPGQAQRMAAGLELTIGSALRELKGTVGLLREAAGPDNPLEPAPGLARLPGLADSFAAAGQRVDATTTGTVRPLSPAVDLTAFRIIQEALTNVAKHAGVRRAAVSLAYAEQLLTVTVANDGGRDTPVAPGPAAGSGHGPGPASPGFGLLGMHERAASVGGCLRAGPRPGGGFDVIAELPLEQRPPPEENEEGAEVPG